MNADFQGEARPLTYCMALRERIASQADRVPQEACAVIEAIVTEDAARQLLVEDDDSQILDSASECLLLLTLMTRAMINSKFLSIDHAGQLTVNDSFAAAIETFRMLGRLERAANANNTSSQSYCRIIRYMLREDEMKFPLGILAALLR